MAISTNATAIIYARVSTSKQADDGLPVAGQIEHGHRKAEALGADVLRVFTDAGISGRTDDRPAFLDAVRYCKIYGVQYFICWDTARFARNRIDAPLYKRELEKTGTRVIYVSMDLDNRTDSGRMLEAMYEVFDEHYSRKVSADTMRSMIKNAMDGYFNGGIPPIGYKAVPDGKRKRLEVVDDEAVVVHDIFGMFLRGAGAKTIAATLNHDGVLNRVSKWNKNTIINLLKNHLYTGKVVFNRINRAAKTVRPMEDWIITQGKHQPIISEDDFMRVQSLFGERAPAAGGGSPHSQFVFTGLLKCGKCGHSMQIESAKGRNRYYHYYNCSAKQKGIGCENRRISAHEMDDWLIKIIMDRVLTRDMIINMMNDLHELSGKWMKERAARRSSTVSELRDVEKRLKKLYEILELHGIDAPNLGDLTERMRELKDQRDRLEEKLIRIEEEEMPVVELSDMEVSDMASLMRDVVLTTEEPKRLRTFFSSFVERVVVNADNLVIEYDRTKLMNRAGIDTVHSKESWLPDLDSNQGPAD